MVKESCLVSSWPQPSRFTVGKTLVIRHGIFPLSKVVRSSVLNLICTEFTHFEYQRICSGKNTSSAKQGKAEKWLLEWSLPLTQRPHSRPSLHPNPAPQLAQQKHVFFCSKIRTEQFCLCRYETSSNSGARCATSLFYWFTANSSQATNHHCTTFFAQFSIV